MREGAEEAGGSAAVDIRKNGNARYCFVIKASFLPAREYFSRRTVTEIRTRVGVAMLLEGLGPKKIET